MHREFPIVWKKLYKSENNPLTKVETFVCQSEVIDSVVTKLSQDELNYESNAISVTTVTIV